MIDRVAAKIGRALVEVPVGFKWFVPGLLEGSLGFGGEESAGASFLRRDGTVWTTDKDGIVMDLLAVELMARTGRDPSELYADLTSELGAPIYERIDAPATSDEKDLLLGLSAEDISASELAGDPIQALLTTAPGNGAAIGGLKVITAHGWFAARPSGTEDVYKLYAESFRGSAHLRRIQEEAQAMIAKTLAGVTMMKEPDAITADETPLAKNELELMNAFWRACNYLSVGMIYLTDNPLLKEPLKTEHVKHRLLGHWGASPALSFVWVHLNRMILNHDLNVIFVAGPGHGAPGVLGPGYLEGTYSEIYPDKSQDAEGMQKFFKQFSFPGHIGSHVTPETPGSIHEGGELGYSLSHAYGMAFDNPDLIVACVVGDGEAETGPLATAWHSNKFLNPVRDGAVLPILNLNGYKIANPTVLSRISHEELEALFIGYGYTPYFVEGSDPTLMHQQMAHTLERAIGEIRAQQGAARASNTPVRPRWPMIVLRSPKGWTGPKEIKGHKVEGSWRSHQVPFSDVRDNPTNLKLLEDWMRSYKPEELFDAGGRLVPELRALAPTGARRMSANPHANGGLLRKDLKLPDFRQYAVDVAVSRHSDVREHETAGRVPSRRHEEQPDQLPPLRP